MAQKHCRKFQSAEYGARTLQTDDRRQTTTYNEHEHEFTFANKNETVASQRWEGDVPQCTIAADATARTTTTAQ